MARTGELSLRVNFTLRPTSRATSWNSLSWRPKRSRSSANSDLFRFAGFGDTLVRGLGDGDVLSDPQGVQISAEAQEKFRAC